jgi:hypothetical protein
MSEAEALNYYTEQDIATEDRHRTGDLNEFELMLEYHGIDEQEWQRESGNRQRQMRWNYNKLGKKTS